MGGSKAGLVIKSMEFGVRCNAVRRVDVGWEGRLAVVGLSAA